MTGDDAAALVAALVAAYPDFIIGVETLTLYQQFLADCKAETAALVVTQWIAVEKRFPRIAELRERYSRHAGTAPPDIDQAWRIAMEAASRGRYPFTAHPAVRAAIDAVGFRDMRLSTEPGVIRAHFARAYEATRIRSVADAAMPVAQRLLPEMKRLMAAPAAVRELETRHERQAPALGSGQPQRQAGTTKQGKKGNTDV
jgi:hypothetical protein